MTGIGEIGEDSSPEPANSHEIGSLVPPISASGGSEASTNPAQLEQIVRYQLKPDPKLGRPSVERHFRTVAQPSVLRSEPQIA